MRWAEGSEPRRAQLAVRSAPSTIACAAGPYGGAKASMRSPSPRTNTPRRLENSRNPSIPWWRPRPLSPMAETNQSIFYNESETVAVGDWMVASTMTGYQQLPGWQPPDMTSTPTPRTCSGARVAMIWPYDERGRLVGENVWEYDESEHDLIKLEPDQVLTTQQAAKQLEPYIKPLPPFD